MLERDGHELVFASDGEECPARLATGRFDLVPMDVRMPVSNGLETTHLRRSSATNTRATAMPSKARGWPLTPSAQRCLGKLT